SIRIPGRITSAGRCSAAAVSKTASSCSGSATRSNELNNAWLVLANDPANRQPVNPRASHRRTCSSQTRSVRVHERRLRDPEAEEPVPFFVDDNATTILLRGADHA